MGLLAEVGERRRGGDCDGDGECGVRGRCGCCCGGGDDAVGCAEDEEDAGDGEDAAWGYCEGGLWEGWYAGFLCGAGAEGTLDLGWGWDFLGQLYCC